MGIGQAAGRGGGVGGGSSIGVSLNHHTSAHTFPPSTTTLTLCVYACARTSVCVWAIMLYKLRLRSFVQWSLTFCLIFCCRGWEKRRRNGNECHMRLKECLDSSPSVHYHFIRCQWLCSFLLDVTWCKNKALYFCLQCQCACVCMHVYVYSCSHVWGFMCLWVSVCAYSNAFSNSHSSLRLLLFAPDITGLLFCVNFP